MNQITFDRSYDKVKFAAYRYMIGIIRKPECHIILFSENPAGFDKWYKLDTIELASACLDRFPASEATDDLCSDS